MHKHISALIISFFLCFQVQTSAQNTISGRVVDENNSGIFSVNIVLLDSANKQLVKSTLTDSIGNFKIEDINVGNYHLRALQIGYENWQSKLINYNGGELKLPYITLKENALKEVVITKQRPFIEVKADRLVVNVENSIVSAGSTALEVLSRSPGVNVDQNDNISLKGRTGVTIMLDGRIVPVSAAELANMLKNMPASQVEKIEIITNPSARYDAAGNAGIINIKTKKDQRMGFNGSATINYGQGIYPKASAGTNLNYRNKKFNLYANYNFSYRKAFNHLVLTRRFYTGNAFESPYSKYDQDHFTLFPFSNHYGGLGLDYSFTKNTVAGINLSAAADKLNSTGNITSVETDTNNLKTASFKTENASNTNANNYIANAFIKHTFDSTGKELNIDLDYMRFGNSNSQKLITNYFNAEGVQSLPTYILSGDVNGLTQIRSVKADYLHPLKNGLRLEAGLKTSFVTAENKPVFYDISNADAPVYDSGKSNHYIYNENINAAYVNAGREGEKWSFQVGLRAEQTNVKGIQKITNQTLNKNYLKLFPSFGVQRNINKNNSLGISLSRRIQRPSYNQLNPFRYYMDPSTYSEGNPQLAPEMTYSASVSHTYKQRFVTSVSYSYTTDVISPVLLPVPGRITVQTNRNIAINRYYSISCAYPFQFFSWWGNVTNLNAYYSQYEGNLANTDLNNGMPSFDLNSSNKFTLPNGFTAELGINYNAPRIYGVMEMRELWMLNAGLQKSILNKRGTLRISATDIFWKGYPRAVSYYSNYNENFVAQRDTRVVYVAFIYRFGKNTVAPIRKRSGGAEEEKQRVG